MSAENNYEICKNCKSLRESGDFTGALDCYACKGKGIRRKDESYICNSCSEVITPCSYGLIDAKVSGGYDSHHLWDLTTYQFSMCEKCLRDLFNNFKVPPATYGNDIEGNISSNEAYEQDRKAHERRLWRDSGAQDARFGTGICNYEEECKEPAAWRECISETLQDRSYCDKHKIEHCGNMFYLPESDLVGVALKNEDRTHEQRIQLCDSIARHYYLGKVCFDKYLSKHFYELLGLPEGHSTNSKPNDSYRGGLWFPNGTNTPENFHMFLFNLLETLKLPSGTLYWGKTTQMGQFEKSYDCAIMNWMCRNDTENAG